LWCTATSLQPRVRATGIIVYRGQPRPVIVVAIGLLPRCVALRLSLPVTRTRGSINENVAPDNTSFRVMGMLRVQQSAIRSTASSSDGVPAACSRDDTRAGHHRAENIIAIANFGWVALDAPVQHDVSSGGASSKCLVCFRGKPCGGAASVVIPSAVVG